MGSILTNPSPPQQQRSQIHSDQNSESVNGLAQKRIRNELKEIQSNSPPNWHVVPSSERWN